MPKLPWSQLPFLEVSSYFSVNHHEGLSTKEASQRLKENGPNIIEQKEKTSPLVLFLSQFRDFMVLVLLGATLLSAALGEYTDAVVIIAIVMLNALLGFIQEFRAEQSLEALRQLTAPTAKVIRDGVRQQIAAEELVPGDVIIVEAGDIVPADIRLGEVHEFAVNEASLTGESEAVRKSADQLPPESSALGDQINMAFMGTMAVGGHAKGIVVETGMDTQMGHVAHLLQDAQTEETPLQKRLEQLGRYLVAGCLLICFLVVLMGLWQGLPPYKMLLAGISLAVAAIPEGLPAVVTIALAIGVQRMVRKNAVVRRLPAVETLGCATVICTDKTGTLTQNKMNVKEIWTGGKYYHVRGDGYSPQGEFISNNEIIDPRQDKDLMLTLTAAVLCNNARLQKNGVTVKGLWRHRKTEWQVEGDPTEGALLVAGARAGIWREELEKNMIRQAEIPFDGNRKRMSVLYKSTHEHTLYVKGAPEIILQRCSFIYLDGKVVELTSAMRQEILKQNETMASMSLRNLAVACRQLSWRQQLEEGLEDNLIFLGLLGMQDPPRPEVFSAIKKCQAAGIKTVMITGDHKTTALAIARQLHLLPPESKVLTGSELDSLSNTQLEKIVEKVYVYARVTPEHKLRIVRALKQKGHIVAMTGDGVNDAPAVKEADIGIAMGKSGTDVTREAADLVLLDDNFSTIVNAVEEGRGIYDNIRKFIRFLLACNTGEILTMLIAMLAGLPVPLQAIQILWINLVTDGLPAMALGVDPVAADIMARPPRSPQEGVFAHGLWQKIIGRGTLIGVSTVLVFTWALKQGLNIETARTMAFTSLIIAQLLYVFNCHGGYGGSLKTILFSNPWLLPAVMSSIFLLLVVLYHPFLTSAFNTCPLQLEHWVVILIANFLPPAVEIITVLLKNIFFPRIVVIKK
ncbi:MAG: calcium-translocating P-type ATPase, SERCA-type [Firmicutes bacterium]|nr:calcium-translocating P-type ATPase, SERCA-type [Bacillota bacterium]